ncbi:MAG: FMN-binding protein [Solirubrobacteraceae bacterium]
MRRALVTLAITAAAVVALTRFHTAPPRTLNPLSALHGRPASRTPSALRPGRPPSRPGVRTATSPPMATPFSLVQVQVTLTHGRLTGVETVALTGEGPHTQALNARAEPILRREALQAHSARIDVVSGATYTSRVWIKSLREAINLARRG